MNKFFATAASALVICFAIPAMAQTNSSTVNQLGTSQTVDVDQIGMAANNYSTVYQGLNTGGASSGNKAEIDQAGTGNIENYSTVIQDGLDNLAKINQSGDGSGGDYNSSLSTQYGNDNKVEVVQGDLVTNNTSLIDQYGDQNKASVRQGGGEGGNLINSSNIDQDGDKNKATVEQGGATVVSNTSYVKQDGVGNVSTINQH